MLSRNNKDNERQYGANGDIPVALMQVYMVGNLNVQPEFANIDPRVYDNFMHIETCM